MIEYTDKILICKTCGAEFSYSVSEQKFFEDKGFAAPIRCQECRNAKKARNLAREESLSLNQTETDANENWVAAMNNKWSEQSVLFKDKE